MVNTGVKQRLGLPIAQGRPPKSYKNPYGVPAQQFYKILRKQQNQISNAKIKQAYQQERQLVQVQRTPEAFERKSVILSDWQGGDF